MSSRLASFKGPSTPTSSPVQQRKTSSAPPSPAKTIESTYHRKLRTLLQELRASTETWDDLVLDDGLKAAKSLVDTRTELEYAVAVLHIFLKSDAFRHIVMPCCVLPTVYLVHISSARSWNTWRKE